MLNDAEGCFVRNLPNKCDMAIRPTTTWIPCSDDSGHLRDFATDEAFFER